MPATLNEAPSAERQRRTVRYEDLRDILEDIEAITAGPVTGVGGWTPAQNIDHVRQVIRMSRAGIDLTLPLPLRILGRMLKGRVQRKPFRAGIPSLDAFQPPADLDLADAVAAFREEVLAAAEPGAMRHPSPLFGPMTHQEWERLHCRHAELHFSHIVPDDAA